MSKALSREQAARFERTGNKWVDGEVSCSKGPSPDKEAVGKAKNAGSTVKAKRKRECWGEKEEK